MAEIELSVLSRQCLDRRLPDFQTLEQFPLRHGSINVINKQLGLIGVLQLKMHELNSIDFTRQLIIDRPLATYYGRVK